MTDKDQNIVDTAARLGATTRSKGWQDILGYIEVRTQNLKNELSKIDLTKELAAACRKQGQIEEVNRIPNKVKQIMTLAEKIEEAEAIKKKEKK